MERVPLDRGKPQRDLLEADDLLFARQSLIAEGAGKVALFLGSSEPTTFESHLIRARIDRSKADPAFVFYYFESPQGRASVRSIVQQVAAAGIRGSDLVQLPVPVPPCAEQARIVFVLRALDEKIDSNRRLAGLLEQTAATLFRRRFVDFAEAREFEVAERPLREVTAMIQRGRAPSYCEEGGTLVINQRCVRDGRLDFGKARRHDSGTRPVAEERMLLPGDVLVNSTGVGTLGRLAPVRWLPEPATIDGHMTIVRPDPRFVGPGYLAWELATRQAEIESLAEGSTGQTELSRSRLAELAIRVPTRSAQEEFERVSKPATAQIAVCEREALLLASIRDALLPKLISGKIHVPDTADPAEVIKPAAVSLAAVS